jgi:inorganic pyrophosphatase
MPPNGNNRNSRSQNMDATKIPTRDEDGGFHVIIEAPKGSRIKFKYHVEWQAFSISRPLVLGLAYPFDWGFVPGTQMPDGDPVDAMVLFDEPTYPGVVIPCRPLGIIRVEQNKKNGSGRERNDRILAVPAKAQRFDHLQIPDDLAYRFRKEIEQFFISATTFENKDAKILGWGTPKEADELIESAIQIACEKNDY